MRSSQSPASFLNFRPRMAHQTLDLWPIPRNMASVFADCPSCRARPAIWWLGGAHPPTPRIEDLGHAKTASVERHGCVVPALPIFVAVARPCGQLTRFASRGRAFFCGRCIFGSGMVRPNRKCATCCKARKNTSEFCAGARIPGFPSRLQRRTHWLRVENRTQRHARLTSWP